MWGAAIAAASAKATKGLKVLSDSDELVQGWIKSRGGELITMLSEESRKAVMNIILRGQGLGLSPKQTAKELRPLIGLTAQQAEANVNYRQKVYQRYIDGGASHTVAAARADKAALKYAGKQHRYRAETIVLTENSFAYNRGAHMGVGQAIADGLMGRCEMVWTTAGTNRVCSRCLALKDTVVGYTDELGVLLPPLHPRCRCAIMYDEVGTPRAMKPKPKTQGLAAGNIDSMTVEGSPPRIIERIEFTPQTIQKTLERYEAQIVKAPVEHAIIITSVGEVYHCNGDLHGIPYDYFVQLNGKLNGAHVTHNHPLGAEENENTFSDEDFKIFTRFKLARLRGIDEKFIYELNRNAKDNALSEYNLLEIYSLGFDFSDYHYAIMLKAADENLGYWRRKR